MTRRFINQIAAGEPLDEVFLASGKQLRTNRNGNLYLQVRLADRSGTLNGMLWNASEQIYGSFENGDYVRAIGTTQIYQGGLQVILNRVERVDPHKINEVDFQTLSQQSVESMSARLSEILRQLHNFHLRNLAECFLIDQQFMHDFRSAPAGIKHHHAYQGGLLEHVVNLLELALLVGQRYPQLDGELLVMGSFLHDIGKLRELAYERDLSYTDDGQLIGHIVIAVEMLNDKIAETEKLSGEPFPPELLTRLKHMILSHHGENDPCSPRWPMTLEAIALHYLDTLDSKLHSYIQMIRDDVNSEDNWTSFDPKSGRKLFKPSLGD